MIRALCALLFVSALLVVPAAAVEIHAAWVRSDVALDGEGDGFALGVGGRWPVGAGPFDVSACGEYVRKKGVQPMIIAPETGPLAVDDAEVTLQCVQASVSGGWNMAAGPLRPRLYAGLAVSLKLDESWDRLAGDSAVDYGYEDLDAALHLGLQLRGGGPVFLDARWTRGLLDQVIVRDGSAAKIDDPTGGADVPAAGDKASWYQVGLGVAF
jgi:hypothetical protein